MFSTGAPATPGLTFTEATVPGDNLYTDSLLAIDPDTGKMKWYFQFTPHDVWDWDAQEFPILLDLPWKGKQRKLVVQANRNGYYYVLDRTDAASSCWARRLSTS